MAPSQDRLLEIFLDVAAIEGLPGRERAIADHLIVFLRDLGLDPREERRSGSGPDAAGNVVCRVGDGGDRALLAHMDTARSTRGLRPRRLVDRVASDGTTPLGVDNRAGVAILLHAVEQAVRRRRTSGFTVAFTVCEETTLAGSRSLSLEPRIESVFVFDSALRPGGFVDRSYGAQRFRSTVHGRAAHSGLAPEDGVSAIRAAARAIADLGVGRIDAETTVNVATIDGGTAINVVPDRVIVEGEVRSLAAAKVDRQVDAIRSRFETVAREEGARAEFESRWDFVPYRHEPGSALYRLAVRAIRAAGLEPRPAVSAGGSDANSLNERGVPAINLGIGAQNPHSNEEFILYEDLAASARIAAALVGRETTV
jgi:tripeptide aminopeptidase